jgi:hypothetical protein
MLLSIMIVPKSQIFNHKPKHKMNKLAALVLFTITVGYGCINPNQTIVIDPTISFNIPRKTEFTIKESIFPKIWEASLEDGLITVYKYSINQGDTITNDSLKQQLKKNVDAFLKSFDLKHIDSTYTFQKEYFQSDLSFDYVSNGVEYKFFSKMVANRQNFVVFCFQTPSPIDNYSQRLKDKIFNSIDIK